MLPCDVTKHPKGQITVFNEVSGYSFPMAHFHEITFSQLPQNVSPLRYLNFSYFISPTRKLCAVPPSKCDYRSHLAYILKIRFQIHVYILQKNLHFI